MMICMDATVKQEEVSGWKDAFYLPPEDDDFDDKLPSGDDKLSRPPSGDCKSSSPSWLTIYLMPNTLDKEQELRH